MRASKDSSSGEAFHLKNNPITERTLFARNDLCQFYKFLQNSQVNSSITNYLLSQCIDWICLPDRSPHFGGLWEEAVKATKFHLKRITGALRFTISELHTIICQIEACLDSRPLSPVNSHSMDGIQILTPGNFLVGRPLTSYPETVIDTQPNLLKRWTMCQSVVHLPGNDGLRSICSNCKFSHSQSASGRHSDNPGRHALYLSLASCQNRADLTRQSPTSQSRLAQDHHSANQTSIQRSYPQVSAHLHLPQASRDQGGAAIQRTISYQLYSSSVTIVPAAGSMSKLKT